MRYLIGFGGLLFWLLALSGGNFLWLAVFLAVGAAAVCLHCVIGLTEHLARAVYPRTGGETCRRRETRKMERLF